MIIEFTYIQLSRENEEKIQSDQETEQDRDKEVLQESQEKRSERRRGKETINTMLINILYS